MAYQAKAAASIGRRLSALKSVGGRLARLRTDLFPPAASRSVPAAPPLLLPRRRLGSASTGGRGGEDDGDGDDPEGWIRPDRPLKGDAGMSQFYQRPRDRRSRSRRGEGGGGEDSSSSIIPEEVRAVLESGKNAGDTIEYVDLERTLRNSDAASLDELLRSLAASGGDDGAFLVDDDDPEIVDVGFDDVPDVDEAEDAENDEDVAIYDEVEEDEELMKLELDMVAEEMARHERQSGIVNGGAKSENDGAVPDEDDKVGTGALEEFLALQHQRRRREGQQQEEEDGTTDDDSPPDWLATRRARLGRAIDMLSPEDAAAARILDGEIPVVPDTLLSSTEITSCLTALGGKDVRVIVPPSDGPDPGGTLIVATGSTYAQIRSMADALVRNLRARGLDRRGVVGARLGAEGGCDPVTSRRRARKRSGGIDQGGRFDDGWMVIDCHNYIVHLQDEETRRHLNLESLWSAGEEGAEGAKLRAVDWEDEDAVDDYIFANPIPNGYESLTPPTGGVGINLVPATAPLGRGGRSGRWNPGGVGSKKNRTTRKGWRR